MTSTGTDSCDASIDQGKAGEHRDRPLVRATRMLVAIIGGAAIGNFVALFASLGIDASYGRKVTGQPWGWSLPNFIYAVIIGLSVGFIAGLIAKRKGWLIGLVAYLAPVVLVGALMVAQWRFPSNIQDSLFHWATLVGVLASMCGGSCAQSLLGNEPLVVELKSMRWHWLWIWLPMLVFSSLIAGSIRFLIADLFIEWQILFRPSFWVLGFIGLPIITGVLYMTFSLPLSGLGYLPMLLGDDSTTLPMSRRKRVALVALVVLGIPLALSLVWGISRFILAFFEANGFRVP